MTSNESPRRPAVHRVLVGLAAAALAVSACGSSDAVTSDDSVASGASNETPLPEDAGPQGLQQNGPITVDGDPLEPFDSSIDDLAVGKVAPVISGESFDGTPIAVGGPADNETLVVFLAHWCPHCNDEIPELIGLFEADELPEGLDVVGVSTAVDSNGDNYPPSDWVVDKGWPWPTMADDEELTAIKAYGGTSFPFVVVLDQEGVVLARRAGSASAAETTAFLANALGS